MNQEIINQVLKRVESFDEESKKLIKSLIDDYTKQNTRLNKILSQSDKQQLELVKLNEQLEESYKKLKITSETDKLTSLSNRLKIEEILSEYMDTNTAFCALMIDIDDFKFINDKFDLLVSNQILIEFSNLLQRMTSDDTFIGRWAGDTFIVIDTSSTLDDMIDKAEEIVEKVEDHFFTTIGKLTVSIGAASSHNNTTLKEMVVSLENALRRAKKHGKNQVSL